MQIVYVHLVHNNLYANIVYKLSLWLDLLEISRIFSIERIRAQITLRFLTKAKIIITVWPTNVKFKFLMSGRKTRHWPRMRNGSWWIQYIFIHIFDWNQNYHYALKSEINSYPINVVRSASITPISLNYVVVFKNARATSRTIPFYYYKYKYL